jgi:hypothetical protein
LLCPSDGGGGPFGPNFGYPGGWGAVTLSRSNYLGFFGYKIGEIRNTPPNRASVFGPNRGASIADILDGTSSTMAMSEYLTGPAGCDRGEHWIDASPGLSALYLHDTPNSSNPDQLYPTTCAQPYCDGNLPAQNLPCSTSVQDNNNMWAAARSRHPGTVNALVCDGAVRPISASIASTTWQDLGFIADGAVLRDF